MPKKQAPKEQSKEIKSTVAETKAKEDAPVASTKHTIKSTEKIPIKGQPVSGKPWRNISTKTRSSKKRVDKVFNTTWELKQKLRADAKDVKQRERALKADVAEKKKAKRELSEARKKQREENEKKSSVVQVITNTQKLKRMNRKQLRNIEKR